MVFSLLLFLPALVFYQWEINYINLPVMATADSALISTYEPFCIIFSPFVLSQEELREHPGGA